MPRFSATSDAIDITNRIPDYAVEIAPAFVQRIGALAAAEGYDHELLERVSFVPLLGGVV